MKKFLLILLIASWACSTSEKETPAEGSEESDQTEETVKFPADDSTGTENQGNQTNTSRLPRVFLTNRMLTGQGPDRDTLYIVSLVAREMTIPLDTVAYSSSISRNEYDQFDIPGNAVDAIGGWYEEAGNYFYIMEDGLDLVVYHAWLKEEQTTNSYPYREVYRLKLPEVNLN